MSYKGSCHCGRVAFEVEGTDPKGNAMAAVNVRCLEGVDLSVIPVENYDGHSIQPVRR